MNRFETLKCLLHEQKCFKMICGAGNENIEQVKKLSFIYTLAGAKILDISANIDVVKSAVSGIDLAYEKSKELEIEIETRPYIMVSIGMPGDHHVRKSYIDPFKCIGCALCAPVCPTDAIPFDFHNNLEYWKGLGGSYEIENQKKEIVIKNLCIGCGKCSNICPKPDIISYRHNYKELEVLLPKCMEAGAELFELHAAVAEHDVSMLEWKLINKVNPNNFNSMCLDRLNLSNVNLKHRIEEVKTVSNNKFMIQADGIPMSGGIDDFNTTLQAVAIADIINKDFNMRIDKKIRLSLNYGHTFGHAIEKITKNRIPHGHAVLIGMKIMDQIFKSSNILNEFLPLFNKYDISKINLKTENLFKYINHDKKVEFDEISIVYYNVTKKITVIKKINLIELKKLFEQINFRK